MEKIKTPIEILLDRVEWVASEPITSASGLPYVTHTGKLKIENIELDVAQLNDGRRIITEESMLKFFNAL